jgi:hypothetical protein
LLLGSETPTVPDPPPPLVGFSYSPMISQALQRDPATDLGILLAATEPDLVRLPVYWEDTQPSPRNLDFSSVDELLAAVERGNEASGRTTRVILTVGARNFLYPELHAPSWAGPRQQPQLGIAQAGAAYRAYFEAAITRYRSSPLLYAWQVENEPFDEVGNEITGNDQISAAQMAWEVEEVHRLDPEHMAVATSYDGWNVTVDWLQLNAPDVLAALHGYPSGSPGAALDAGDALGLDIYVDGPTIPMRFTSIALRTSWKAEALKFWSVVAKAQHKQLWLTEMQAEPWGTMDTFTTADLLASAAAYRHTPLHVALLWGVDTWLQDPAWMAAAVKAMGIMRAAQPTEPPGR